MRSFLVPVNQCKALRTNGKFYTALGTCSEKVADRDLWIKLAKRQHYPKAIKKTRGSRNPKTDSGRNCPRKGPLIDAP